MNPTLRYSIITLFALLLLPSCNTRESAASTTVSDEELCQCVNLDEAGQWDGALSESCIEAYMERFGQDLSTIHTWYIEHCPSYKLKQHKQKVVI